MQLAKQLIVIGTAESVLDQLVDFYEIVGKFGTLMVTGHDVSDDPDLWRKSMTVLAQEVAHGHVAGGP